MDDSPLPNGPNGRDERGRFSKGNAGGPGNPHAQHVGKLRAALLKSVSAADVKAVVASLVRKARRGDTSAAKVLFDRLFGPPLAADVLQRIEELETYLEERKCESNNG